MSTAGNAVVDWQQQQPEKASDAQGHRGPHSGQCDSAGSAQQLDSAVAELSPQHDPRMPRALLAIAMTSIRVSAIARRALLLIKPPPNGVWRRQDRPPRPGIGIAESGD